MAAVRHAATVTVEEAAQMLGVGRDTMYRAVAAGELRVIRIGRRIVVPKWAVNAKVGTEVYPGYGMGPGSSRGVQTRVQKLGDTCAETSQTGNRLG